MKIVKKICLLLALCTVAFSLVACGNKKENSQPEIVSHDTTQLEEETEEILEDPTFEEEENIPIEESEEPEEDGYLDESAEPEVEVSDGPNTEIANPIVTYDSVEDAVIHVGHLCTTPDIYARYTQKASVIADTLIQIVYLDDKGEILTLREQAGTEKDISGNYNEFAYTTTIQSNGNDVTLKGTSKDSIQLAIWNDGAYAHSLDYVTGVSLEEVTAAVNAIQ